MPRKQNKDKKSTKNNSPQSTEIKSYFKGDTPRFIFGLFVLAISLFMLLAFTSNFFTGTHDQSGIEAHTLSKAANYAGGAGAYTAYYFMNRCFGVASYFIPIVLILFSMKLMRAYRIRMWKWFLNCSFLMIWISTALSYVCSLFPSITSHLSFDLGGNHGIYVCNDLLGLYIGKPGTFIVLILTAALYLIYLSKETIDVIRTLLTPQAYIKGKRNKDKDSVEGEEIIEEEETEELNPKTFEDPQTVSIDLSDKQANEEGDRTETEPDVTPQAEEPPVVPEPNGGDLVIENQNVEEKAEGKTVEEVLSQQPIDPRAALSNYHFPTLNLLKKYGENNPSVDMAEQHANSEKIKTILGNFGVEISGIKATIGPTITLYEITPAKGVRISKIRNLEDDIALSLSALGIRIIAPIPGKGTIGIEVPNKNPQIVSMESILNSKKFQGTKFDLPIALGKTITNEVYMVDLAKMPHLLVAGATGMGKSVGLNAIITSLLYKKHPAELKLVMIDPKKVEFSVYAPIVNHFLAKIPGDDDPIITDVTKVVQTLKSLCQLMDHRYDLLKMAKVRNVKEYNEKFKAHRLNPENGHEFMPYIVVIIDEFGDLIMTAGKEVELPIARIAQLARAVGIHMVIATQRPTTNIITGTIKANFPARMAFKVMSQIDSRTILDRTGANQLVGKGDMLFLCNADPVRVQCAFVDTPEVEDINNFIAKQQGYLGAFELPEVQADSESSSSSGNIDSNNLDPLFADAARLIVIHQQGSTSLIQRKFAIGYNRAGRLMDQLEHAGIVGPAQGSKPREVMCSDEADLELRLNNLQ